MRRGEIGEDKSYFYCKLAGGAKTLGNRARLAELTQKLLGEAKKPIA